MNRSKSEVDSKFVLPGGVATNSEQLKYLQRKLLQNYYQSSSPQIQSTKTKRDFANELTLSRKSEDFQKERGLNQYDIQARKNEKQMKNALSYDLAQQMKTKNFQRMREKSDQKMQEQILNKYISGLQALEKEKQKQFNQKYKMEALEDLKYKENKKIMDSMLSENQKAFYRNRYSMGDLHQGFQSNASYTNPTKQYYYEMDKALRERDGRLAKNPEYSAYNSSFKVTRRNGQLPQLDFMVNGQEHKSNYNQQHNFYQGNQQREIKERLELKETLLNQIRQKESIRRSEKQREFNVPYTKQEYQGMHHPIYNPVDFKHAHDNIYVMKELGSIK